MQHTLAGVVEFLGIGVHSGEKVNVKIFPADIDSGIVFIRSDLAEGTNRVGAYFDNVIETAMCTKIANIYGASVGTIEHLMAAFWGVGVDNAIVVLDGPEVPVMDGSSSEFIRLIKNIGILQQAKCRKQIIIDKEIKVVNQSGEIKIEPSDVFSVSFEIEFNNKFISSQSYDFHEQKNFEEEIGQARTFGFINDVEKLKNMGLAKGASLDNAIAIGEDGILNKGGLRYQDEFVRHKVLDCIGDLYLASARIRGKVTAYKSGHGLNNLLLRKIFDAAGHCHFSYAA